MLQFKAGWYAPEYHLMGWALSCLQLTKYYDNVVLYADTTTSKMLIDALQLPYTDLVCNLDSLNNYNPNLWALPKIHTYAQQNDPFLHVDGDVFIWKAFDDQLLNGELIAQNLEIGTAYYKNMLEGLDAVLKYFPTEIITGRKKDKQIYAYNAGILGGSDAAFFKLYAAKAKKFINKNAADFSKISVVAFNIFFEQYLFYCCAQKDNRKVKVLLDEVIADNNYTGFGDFAEVPHNVQYLHLIGPYKRNRVICEQMANRLRQDYPDYYYRIITLFKDKKIPLKKDYYFFIDKADTESLTARASVLKAAFKNNSLPVSERSNIVRTDKIDLRFEFVKKFISDNPAILNSNDGGKCTKQLNDLKKFEARVVFMKNKFEVYSKDYLYARDLAHTEYYQFVFGEKGNIYNKILVADSITEIVESRFDWSEIFPEDVNIEKLIEQLKAQPSNFYTGFVPECDVHGYSLINLDDLDRLLLEIMQTPVTIDEILNRAKSSFNPTDLEASASEFEQLVTGRIKLALISKLIKAVI